MSVTRAELAAVIQAYRVRADDLDRELDTNAPALDAVWSCRNHGRAFVAQLYQAAAHCDAAITLLDFPPPRRLAYASAVVLARAAFEATVLAAWLLPDEPLNFLVFAGPEEGLHRLRIVRKRRDRPTAARGSNRGKSRQGGKPVPLQVYICELSGCVAAQSNCPKERGECVRKHPNGGPNLCDGRPGSMSGDVPASVAEALRSMHSRTYGRLHDYVHSNPESISGIVQPRGEDCAEVAPHCPSILPEVLDMLRQLRELNRDLWMIANARRGLRLFRAYLESRTQTAQDSADPSATPAPVASPPPHAAP